MKLKVKILLVILVLAIISNAVVHVFEIRNSMKEEGKLVGEIVKTNFGFQLAGKILLSHKNEIIKLYNRVSKLEKRKPIVINKMERQVPDFEKLMNGTVVIYNRGYSVAGACIAEDETYYYILTVEHLLRDREENTKYPRNVVPESNMGLVIKLEAIVLFITNDEFKELIPKEEIINTTVRTRDYTMVAGEFMYVSSLLDLGVLRIYKNPRIKLEVIKIADNLPKIGDEIYVLGHPLGRQYNLSKGIVSNLDRSFVMGVDALMTFGNSGGGVFNTKGELIGICSRVPVYKIEFPEGKGKELRERLIDLI